MSCFVLALFVSQNENKNNTFGQIFKNQQVKKHTQRQ
jgi:hypothetical protein